MSINILLEALIIRGYCFNKQCADSIYQSHPKVVDVPLEKALDGSVTCESCGQQIHSEADLDLSKQILIVLKNGKPEKKPGLRKV